MSELIGNTERLGLQIDISKLSLGLENINSIHFVYRKYTKSQILNMSTLLIACYRELFHKQRILENIIHIRLLLDELKLYERVTNLSNSLYTCSWKSKLSRRGKSISNHSPSWIIENKIILAVLCHKSTD